MTLRLTFDLSRTLRFRVQQLDLTPSILAQKSGPQQKKGKYAPGSPPQPPFNPTPEPPITGVHLKGLAAHHSPLQPVRQREQNNRACSSVRHTVLPAAGAKWGQRVPLRSPRQQKTQHRSICQPCPQCVDLGDMQGFHMTPLPQGTPGFPACAKGAR